MTYTVDAAYIFTLFFIMLGPVKLLIPFAKATHSLDIHQLRALSLRAVIAASLISVVGCYIGHVLLANWKIPVPVLMLGAGIIFFLVALNIVLPKPHEGACTEPAAAPPTPTIMQVVFPLILTPYGLAAVIALLSSSADMNRTLTIIGILLANMVLNLLAMIYVRPILKFITPTGMQILFSVLGVLMIGLALQMILSSLSSLHIIPAYQ